MTDATTPAPAPVPRERGWRRLVAGLLAFLLVPLVPLLRAALPVEQTMLLLVPALAACALIGWSAGGRLALAVVWVACAAWMLAEPVTGGAAAYDRLARGWALVLAAAFGFASVGAGGGPRLRHCFPRALAALGVAVLFAAGALLAGPGSPTSVPRVVRAELDRRNDISVAALREFAASPGWRDFVAQYPDAASLADQSEQQLRVFSDLTVTVFPALLALESLAALALAWSLYHRLSRARIGLPLAPLREFRFNDQLVWGVIVGVTLLVVPALGALRGPGINLLVFFGALYALRGLGVLTWFLAPGRLAAVPLIGFALLAWPVFTAVALGLGLGDTWLDWRSNRARTVS